MHGISIFSREREHQIFVETADEARALYAVAKQAIGRAVDGSTEVVELTMASGSHFSISSRQMYAVALIQPSPEWFIHAVASSRAVSRREEFMVSDILDEMMVVATKKS